MRTLLYSNNKRGISTIIAYVLLISITLSLSVMVFNWLKLYTNPDEISECPDGVSISITNYNCQESTNNFLYTLKNTGRFTIKSVQTKINNQTNATFGMYDRSVYYTKKSDDLLLDLTFDDKYIVGGEDYGTSWIMDGKIGGARSFDGEANYIDLGNNIFDLENQLTISSWVKINSDFVSESPIFRKDGVLQLGFLNRTTIRNLIGTTGTTGWTIANDIYYEFDLDKWYLLTMSWDGSIMNTYVNDEPKGSAPITGQLVSNSLNSVIGANSNLLNSLDFNGTLDEIKIYNRALSSEEVENLYKYNAIRYISDKQLLDIKPGDEYMVNGNYTDSDKITLIQAQPIVIDKKDIIYCKPVIQKVTNCN